MEGPLMLLLHALSLSLFSSFPFCLSSFSNMFQRTLEGRSGSAEGSKCEQRSHLLLEKVNYTGADAPAGSPGPDAGAGAGGTLDHSGFCKP